MLEGRLGIGKESVPISGAALNSSVASSRFTSSTSSVAIIQGGKVKRIGSFAEADQRRQSGSKDDITENEGDENPWNELDEVSQSKNEAEQIVQSSAIRVRSSNGVRPQSRHSMSAHGQQLQPSIRREIEEQLAETLYKRAQAKMMLPVHEDSVIESALVDAWRVRIYSGKLIYLRMNNT